MGRGVKCLDFPLPAHRSVVACVPLKGTHAHASARRCHRWKSIFARRAGRPWWHFCARLEVAPRPGAWSARGGIFAPALGQCPAPARGALVVAFLPRLEVAPPPRRVGRPWWHPRARLEVAPVVASSRPPRGSASAPARGAPQDVAAQILHSVKHAAQSCNHLVNRYTGAGRKKKKPPLLACARFLDAVFTRFASRGNHVCALARALLCRAFVQPRVVKHRRGGRRYAFFA